MIGRKAIVIFMSLTLVYASYTQGQTVVNTPDLESENFGKRQRAMEMLTQQRREIVERLISVLKGNFSADVKEDAAKLLGNFRASESVDALAQNIDLDIRVRVIKGLLLEEDIHPISEALVKIGNPSIATAVGYLQNGDSPKLREVWLKVILRIEGDKNVAQLRLRQALEAQKDSQKKARLESSMQALMDSSFEEWSKK
jgi:hypothetical protein